MLSNLREEREVFVEDSTKAAWKLFERHAPKLAKSDLPRFGQRVEARPRRARRRDSEGAAASASRTRLRSTSCTRSASTCKRLRYTLDLFPSARRQPGWVLAPPQVAGRPGRDKGQRRDDRVPVAGEADQRSEGDPRRGTRTQAHELPRLRPPLPEDHEAGRASLSSGRSSLR